MGQGKVRKLSRKGKGNVREGKLKSREGPRKSQGRARDGLTKTRYSMIVWTKLEIRALERSR